MPTYSEVTAFNKALKDEDEAKKALWKAYEEKMRKETEAKAQTAVAKEAYEEKDNKLKALFHALVTQRRMVANPPPVADQQGATGIVELDSDGEADDDGDAPVPNGGNDGGAAATAGAPINLVAADDEAPRKAAMAACRARDRAKGHGGGVGSRADDLLAGHGSTARKSEMDAETKEKLIKKLETKMDKASDEAEKAYYDSTIMFIEDGHSLGTEGGGKAAKYPRQIRLYIKNGCFTSKSDFVAANRSRAIEWATKYVNEDQNVAEKAKKARIRDYKSSFDEYVKAKEERATP